MIVAPLVCGFVWINDSSKIDITYELDGGVNSPQNQTKYLKTDGVVIFEDAEKEGYDFVGWYTSEDFSEETKITEIDLGEAEDMTLYAKFIKVMEYTPSGVLMGLTDYGKTKTEIVIPKSCVEIGMYAFKNANNLERVVAEDAENLKVIKMGAFYNCPSLTEISLPANIEAIEGMAFTFQNVNAITFPNGSVNYALENGSLVNKSTKTLAIGGTDGYIPSDVEIIGDYAFWLNTAVTEIKIPDSVKILGSHAFSNCHNLETIEIGQESLICDVGKYAFGYCYKVKEINLPNGVRTLGNGAFAYCKSLTSFTFPESLELKVIGSSTFSTCESLKSIVIPEGVEEIESDAFENCLSLTEIVIPESVKSIDGDALQDSTGIKVAKVKGNGTWKIKPFMRASIEIDQSFVTDEEMFAEVLTTNYIGTRLLGNTYARFTWVRG